MKTALARSRGASGRHGRALGTAIAALTIAGMALLASPAVAAPAPVSQASAQAVNLDLGPAELTLQSSSPATTAHNDGTQSNAPITGSPVVTALSGQSLIAAGALAEVAEANADGSSYACAGMLSPGGGIGLGSGGTTCAVTGTGTGGITLKLNQLPNLDPLLDGISLVRISADSMIAHAYSSGGSAQGAATIASPVVHVVLDGGKGTFNAPLILSGDPNEDVLTAIVTALTDLGDPLLADTIDAMTVAASPDDLTANFQQTSPDGSLQVSALHIVEGGAGGGPADLASVTVGPNTIPAPVTPASLTISPAAPAVIAGTAQNVTVAVLDSAGDPLTGVTGLDLTSSVASDTITDNGGGSFTVSGTTAGARTLTATLGTLEATSSLTVKPDAAHPAAIALALSKTTVETGDSITATVSGTDAYGNDLGDLTGQASLTSDHATDVISGDTVRFPHASTHVITATLPVAGGASLTATATVTVTATPTAIGADALAATGGEQSYGVGLALLLVLAGGILTTTALWHRRRSAA